MYIILWKLSYRFVRIYYFSQYVSKNRLHDLCTESIVAHRIKKTILEVKNTVSECDGEHL